MASGSLHFWQHWKKGMKNRRKEKKMMTAEEVRKRIEELSEPSYQQFSARLIPNVKAERIRGVRLPHLRKLAKEIVKGDWRAYLEEKSEVEKTYSPFPHRPTTQNFPEVPSES